MDNLAALLRKNNIFAPTSNTEPQPMDEVPRPNVTSPNDDFIDYSKMRMAGLYNPRHDFEDRYINELDNIPMREKPGLASRIFAGLAGAAGDIDLAEKIKYGGYLRNMADFNFKLNALKPGLDLEKADNTNLRNLAEAQIRDETNRMREERLTNTSNQRLELDRRKLALQEAIANNPSFKVIRTRGGTVKLVDSKSGNTIDTGIPDGELSQLDEINLRGKLANELEGTRQDNRVDLATLRSQLSLDTQRELAELRSELSGSNFSTPVQAFDREGKPLPYMIAVDKKGNVKRVDLPDGAVVKTVPPGSGGSNTTLNETQLKQQRTNRANKFLSKHPELKKAITISKDGTVVTAKAGDNVGGALTNKRILTQQEINQINKYLDTGDESLITPSDSTASSSDKIRVRRKSDGKTGVIPRANFDRSKYEEIK